MTARVLTDAQVADARRLREVDPKTWTLVAIARHFGVSKGAIRGALIFYENSKRTAGLGNATAAPISRDELHRRLSLIPPDDRSLTARFFGDPPPGRSALDQRRQGRATT